jgi:uncharacterized membrane protein
VEEGLPEAIKQLIKHGASDGQGDDEDIEVIDRIEDLFSENDQHVISRIIMSGEMFQGPLPSPSILSAYKDVEPTAPDRIISMAESQQKHHNSIQKTQIDGSLRLNTLGMVFAFIIAMTMIILTTVLIMSDHKIPAAVMGGTTMVILVGMFLRGQLTRSDRFARDTQEDEEHDEEKEETSVDK